MHETSILREALALALQSAVSEGATRITSMTMCVGEASGVVKEALEFAWEPLTQGTFAQNAKLIIESVPIVCVCPNGCPDFPCKGPIYECPQCKSLSVQLRSGLEIEVVEVEIEDS